MDKLEFPRLVYKSASNHLLVETQAEYDSAIKDGWFGSVPEALTPKPTETAAEKKAREKAEAEAVAKQLEIDKKAEEDAKRLILVEEALTLKIEVKEDWDNAKIEEAIEAAKSSKSPKPDAKGK